MGADERVVAISHSVRVLLVVSVLPFVFRLTTGLASGGGAGGLTLWTPLPPTDAAVLAACALAGPH
eukprot:3924276-Pyramimonas_sp.AAC.1